MTRYRKISVLIWNDDKFPGLSDDAQLVFFFLLTHPNMTSVGGMRHTIGGLSSEKRWKSRRFLRAFDELVKEMMVEYDENASCIILPNFIKHNPPDNNSMVASWTPALDLIPDCGLKSRHIQRLTDFLREKKPNLLQTFLVGPYGTPCPAPCTSPCDQGVPHKDKDKEKDKELEKDKDKDKESGPPQDRYPKTDAVSTAPRDGTDEVMTPEGEGEGNTKDPSPKNAVAHNANTTDPAPAAFGVLCAEVGSFFGRDRGIIHAMSVIGNHLAGAAQSQVDAATGEISVLFESCKTAENPAPYFMAGLQHQYPRLLPVQPRHGNGAGHAGWSLPGITRV
jgi:hypothetical protein